MMCQEIKLWTFVGLTGAFLDLGITYFLLCASTLAYFVSKVLDLFGTCLPCPCNGQFGDPNRNKCWQRVFVKCPSENISSVRFSVMNRFPFDSVLDRNLSFGSDTGVGLDGEASRSLFKERESGMCFGNCRVCVRDGKEGRVSSLKQRNLRQRRKGDVDNLRSSSVISQDHLQSDARDFSRSPASVSKITNEISGGNSVPASSGGEAQHYGEDASMDVAFPEGVLLGCESKESVDENKSKDVPPADNFKGQGTRELSFYGDESNTIRVLEQELEELRAAHAALYDELEKERSAAATAADEAMAMILRLQEEKASIEMQARQYQRMIEEKSAYDREEMNILKEILLRREKEKHFLEKEVEAYRQMIFGNEQLDSDVQDIGTPQNKMSSSSLYFGENQPLMLGSVSEYINKEEKEENANMFSEAEARSIESPDHFLASEKVLPIPELDEVNSLNKGCFHRHPSIGEHHQNLSSDTEETKDFEKKEVVSLDKRSFDQVKQLQKIEAHAQLSLSSEKCNEGDGNSKTQDLPSKKNETCEPAKINGPHEFDDLEKHEKYSYNAEFDVSTSVHDVHVIDDNLSVYSEVSEVGSKQPSLDAALDLPTASDSPAMRRLENELDTRKSCPDMATGLPPIGCSRKKSSLSDLRRNSMSAVDYERFKIDSEVGWLRERLRVIQEGREKLNMSMDHKEKGNTPLQLLRQLTEPAKPDRQASLPLTPCKVTSKKRRWRCVSLGLHRSN